MVTTPPTYTALPWGRKPSWDNSAVFLSWAQFVTFLSPFSPPLFLSMVCSALSLAHVSWALVDFAAASVCGIFYGSLCLQRGAGQLKVFRASGKPPSTAASPVMQVGRGTPWPPQAQNLSSLCPSMAGSELLGRRGWP